MSERLDISVVNLCDSVRHAFTTVLNKIDQKLGSENNFEAGASGLQASDLNSAILEVKGLVDALNAVYSTDAEMASAIQAVNDAWAAADSSITGLVSNKVNVSTYNANKTATDAAIATKLDVAVYEVDKATFLTVDDIIDLGVI